jgi:polyketide synthase PksN
MISTRQIYSARLLADDPIIRDHLVHGVPILPGVAFLDLVLRMAQTGGLDPARLAMRRILFVRPVALQHGQMCDLRVVFEPAGRFCVVTVNGQLGELGPPIEHMRAELHDAEPLAPRPHSPLKLNGGTRSVSEVYALARRAGIEHRDFMLPQGSISVSGLEVTARLELGKSARAHLDNFLLHPAMLDAATVLGAAPSLAAGGGDTAYIPVYLHEFQTAGPLPPECWISLRARPSRENADLHTVDIELHDERGSRLARFRRLDAKRIRQPDSLQAETAQAPSGWAATDSSPLLSYLQGIVAEQSGAAPADVPTIIGFYDQGLESKHLLQIVQRLERDLQRDFYPTLLFEYPTVGELAEYLAETCGDKLNLPSFSPPIKERSNVPAHANSSRGVSNPDAIAIIGLAGRYPMAPDLDTLWENLKAGMDCVREVPPERWDWRAFHSPEKGSPGKAYCQRGSWLENHDCFDARLFHVSPNDAARMDPQERLFLECAWALLEDAGYAPRDFGARHGQRVGVFAGAMWSEYQLFAGQEVANSWHASIANRVSYAFDFRGPSMAVDAMCSTSLLAVHLACESLRRGECNAAIAGGVNLSLHPQKYIQLSQMRMLATDGHCRSFGVGGDGYVPGEGVGAVLLKPLSAARRDGDRIDGVILGSACNHGGATGGYTVPSPQAQAALLRQAWTVAGIDPRTLGYIEAHGTGTALGDPIEIEGIAKAFREFGQGAARCAIGSIKSNLGHLESAAGIAALTKVLLQLRHGQLAPSIHSDELNPRIDWASAPVEVQRKISDWPARQGRRRAGISSFGAGGTNVHLVVEEPPQPVESSVEGGDHIVILSARDAAALRDAAVGLSKWLRWHPEAGLAEVAATLRTGREAMAQRLGMIVDSRDGLSLRLQDFLDGRFEDVYTGRAGKVAPPEIDATPAALIAAWVAGAVVDWNSRQPRRTPPLSLPNYPFARERYWVGGIRKQGHSRSSDPNLDQLLADHLVLGTPVLPGAAFLSLALDAADAIAGLEWKRPAKDGKVELQRTGDNLRLAGKNGDGIFAEATVADCMANPPTVDVDVIRRRCERTEDDATIYAGFARAGLVYGSTLRRIARWHIGHEEVLAELQPESGWIAAFDAAIQSVASLLPKDGELRIPRRIGKASRFKDPSAAAFVHARSNTPSAYDVVILNAEGKPLAVFEKLAFGEIKKPSTLICAPQWTPSPVSDRLIAAQAIILLDRDGRRFEDWRRRDNLPPLILVKTGASFERSERNSYILRPGEPDDWRRLLDEISYDPVQPLASVHAWATGENFPAEFSQTGRAVLEKQIEHGLLAALRLTQAVLSRRPKAAVRLVYLSENPLGAAIGGFARALRLENPRFVYQTLRGGDPLLELAQPQQVEVEVRYDAAIRLGRKFVALDNDTASPTPWRERGTYLITGGVGGLGLLIAGHLVEVARAQLILVGRSRLNAEQESAIESLRAAGGLVLHVAADISKPAAMRRVVNMARREFGGLHGVIHCAGITRDEYVTQKTATEMREVLRPKIDGSLTLDTATSTEALDFFVVFSSLAGLMGNPGQTDYAAANSFLAGFTEWRNERVAEGSRHGRTVCIDWPLWASGGMKVDAASAELLRQSSGLEPLPVIEGLAAFEQVMRGKANHVAVAFGDRHKLSKVFGIGNDLVPESKSSASTLAPTSPSFLRATIIELLCATLRLRPDDVDFDVEVSEFGFDSVTLTSFVAELNGRLNLKLNPAIFYEHTTLDSFSRYILDELGEAPAKTDSHPPNPIQTPMAPRIATVTEVHAPPWMAIAIIGMAAKFPQSNDLAEFWEHLVAGDDLIQEVPADRWDWRAFYGDPHLELNKTFAKWGGFMRGVDTFDAEFFGVSRREAELMDPQQRLFLQVAWHTLEDAGVLPSRLKGSKTGVFVGASTSDYAELILRHHADVEAHMATGLAHSMLANRLSYFLDFRGPSEVVDTACSSSLVAVHRAVRAMLDGECDMALVGGVNLMLTPTPFIAFSQAGMLSPDGRCKPFGKQANGYVRGEGCGAVLLKPLERATGDGNRIYAVIRSTAVSHGGHASSLTAPNPNAQAELLIRAYERAGFSPHTLGYVETHGTGTALGDPIEVNGLKKAFAHFGPWTAPQATCGLGSVKSNMGHLETAAGIAGLIKAALAVHHGVIPASLHAAELNPNVELLDGPFYVVTKTKPWRPTNDTPRRAGVSSFGFGGSNAHVALEESPQQAARRQVNDAQIIPLSARDSKSLCRYAESVARHLRQHPEMDLADVAWTLQTGRACMDTRLIVVARTIDEAIGKLDDAASGQLGTKGLFHGQRNGHDTAAEVFQSAPEDKDYLSKLSKGGHLEKLARLWAQGVEIDWRELTTSTARIVSLPAYPFKADRHWIDPLNRGSSLPSKLDTATPKPPPLFFYRPLWHPCPLLVTGQSKQTALIIGESRGIDLRPISCQVISNLADLPDRQSDYFILRAPAADTVVDPERYACRHLLRMIQELLRAYPTGLLRGLYLHEGSVPDQAVIALTRSLSLEHPRFILSTLETDAPLPEGCLAQELASQTRPEAIRYRVGRRLVHRLKPIDLTASPEPPWRRHGVYLIAGGLGELGTRLGVRLARGCAARLVFLGRGELDESGKARLEEIRRAGAKAMYVRADITLPSELARAVQSGREAFGPFNGVFHLARVVDDGPVEQKSAAAFDRATAAKVLGAQYLDESTRQDPLDCFVLFSSLAASVGLPNATDYAWSCAYQERFAEERHRRVVVGDRRGRSLAVAWSQWAHDRHSTPGRDANLQRLGFALLDAETGMRALETALAGNEPVIAIAAGDNKRFEIVLPMAEEAAETLPNVAAMSDAELDAWLLRLQEQETAATTLVVGEQAIDPGSRDLRKSIIAVFATVLKLTPEEIPGDRNIVSYGLDSISALIVANRLQNELRRTVDPKMFFDHPTIDALVRALTPLTQSSTMGVRS